MEEMLLRLVYLISGVAIGWIWWGASSLTYPTIRGGLYGGWRRRLKCRIGVHRWSRVVRLEVSPKEDLWTVEWLDCDYCPASRFISEVLLSEPA